MRVQLDQLQQDMFLKYIKKTLSKKKTDKDKDINEFTKKFRELGKKKRSRSDFIKLYKEMKKFKEDKK